MAKLCDTLESLLAVQELEQKTIEAEGSTASEYKEFVESTEAEAIETREDESEEDASEDDGLDADPTDGLDDGFDDPDTVDDSDAKIELKDDDITVESLNGSAGFITASVGDIMAGLASIGIKYTPVVSSLMFKGALWMFSRMGTLVAKTAKGISKYVESNRTSYQKLSARLGACRKDLAILAERGVKKSEQDYTDTRVISRLKVGRSTSFEYNIRQASAVIKTLVDSLVKEAENGYRIAEELASKEQDKTPKSINSMMDVKPGDSNLIKGTLQGYENKTGDVIQYRSKSILPGDAVFLFNAPQVENRDIEGIAESYRAATAFLAADVKNIVVIDKVQSLGVHDLVRLTAATAQLLELTNSLSSSLQKLNSLQPSLAYSVKKLFLRLADEEAKTRLSFSFIEPMYLRSSFASGVLLSAVMELNTYASRVAAASIQLTEEHIRKMS